MFPAQAPAQAQPLPQLATAEDGAGIVAVAQLQAQIAALRAELNQFAVNPQLTQAPAVQHVNPNTIDILTPFSSSDIVKWIDRYVLCADFIGWNKNHRLQRLPSYFTCQASLL